jgi:hypothetical protein
VESLEAFAQHRSVVLLAKPARDVHASGGVDPQEVPVVGEVVNRTEREPVDYGGNAFWRRVRHDVRRLDEFALPEGADRAAMLVGPEDIISEALLVETGLHHAKGIRPGIDRGNRSPGLDIDEGDAHFQQHSPFSRVILGDEHGRDREVTRGSDAFEVDQRSSEFVCRAEGAVIRLLDAGLGSGR